MNSSPFSLLEKLLPHLAMYQTEVPADSQSAFSFADWLTKQAADEQQDTRLTETGLGPHVPLESILFRYIVQLFRLLKQETKAASDGLPINHLDEFVMLMTVMDKPGIRKNDLVSINRMETSSGNDMVNRLIRQGYLREEANGRFRHLYITERGRDIGHQLAQRYNAVTRQITTPLTPVQLVQVVRLLARIDQDDQLMAGV